MHALLRPAEISARAKVWCDEEVALGRLPRGSWPLIRQALAAGEFGRGEAPALTGYQERQARTVLNTLVGRGVLVSPTTRSTVRIGIPSDVVERWLPALYPAEAAA
jgi:hypothetical protein